MKFEMIVGFFRFRKKGGENFYNIKYKEGETYGIMKIISNRIIFFLLIIIFISCTKNFDEISYIPLSEKDIKESMEDIIETVETASSYQIILSLEKKIENLEMKVVDNTSLAIIYLFKDINDLKLEEEYQKYMEQQILFDKLKSKFNRVVLEGKFHKEYSSTLSKEELEIIKFQMKFNIPETESLKNERNQLVSKYNILVNETLYDTFITWENKEMRVEDIKEIEDGKIRVKLLNQIYKKNSKEFSELLIQIINIDKKIADISGFSSPMEMYYKQYNHSFSYKDSLEFSKQTKDYLVPLLKYNFSYNQPYKMEMLIQNYPKILKKYNKDMLAVWDKMLEKNLYDVEKSEKKQANMNFVTYLYNDNVPYLLINEGDTGSLHVLSHEFAHFYDFWINKGQVHNSSEINEMFGQINPVFLMVNLDELYNDSKKSREIRDNMLFDYVRQMIGYAMAEEFYIRLYQDENLSDKKIAEIFSELSSDYLKEDVREKEDYSLYVKINVEMPFYDITYWRGTHVGLQFFFLAQEDTKSASDIFTKMLRSDKGLSFIELINDSGLKDPSNSIETKILFDKLNKLFSSYN